VWERPAIHKATPGEEGEWRRKVGKGHSIRDALRGEIKKRRETKAGHTLPKHSDPDPSQEKIPPKKRRVYAAGNRIVNKYYRKDRKRSKS